MAAPTANQALVPKLVAYMDAVAGAFTEARSEVQAALALIRRFVKPTQNAQALALLALRRYLRLGEKKIHANWAWTAEEAQRFIRQGTGKLLTDEAAKVQRKFARENPGYVLVVSPLRSLERQVRLWNSNSSVQRSADRLWTKMLDEIDQPEVYPSQPTGLGMSTFRSTLRGEIVSPEPTSAAPGTSDHGQMRAVDFVVTAVNGVMIASVSSSSIQSVWKKGGWEAKLVAATAGTKLIGPLPHPYEPWHWRLPR